MSQEKAIRPPLIIDSDKAFINELQTAKTEPHLPPIVAVNGREAQIKIADATVAISAVFVNLAVTNPGGLSVIRSAHQNRPGLPVYILYDEKLPFEERELKLLGVQKALKKPISYQEILKFVTPPIEIFSAEKVVKDSKQFNDTLNTELSINDQDFIPIRSEDFLAGTICFFDIYVRLTSGKYIKILQSGDQFTADRVLAYIKKGVVHFYIRKEFQKHYLTYCEKLATTLAENSNASMDLRVSQVLNHGEETLKLLKNVGISEASLQFAKQFVGNVNKVVKDLHPDKQPVLKDFMNDVLGYEHGVGVSMIAGLIMETMSITSADPVEAVGVAALLHDIALPKLNPPISIEDQSKMSPEQLIVYKTHPVVGAEMLGKVRGLKPVVIQAVAQHHERRNKKGFPDGIGAGSISLVAEIVGISDEYYRLLQRQKENAKINMSFELEHLIFHAFSGPLVTEFKKVFGYKIGEVKKIPIPAKAPNKPGSDS